MSASKSLLHDTAPAEVLALGQTSILVRFGRHASDAATAACLAFNDDVRAAAFSGVTDVVPSLTSVLVQFDPTVTTRATLGAALQPLIDDRPTNAQLPAAKRRWHIPVAFGGEHGPQLQDFAEHSGLTQAQIIADAQATDLRVLAIGFAPGQPYLGYLPDTWQVPRQRELTPQVPAGAIVTAVRQMVLFCNASTTGWRQIAQTGFRPFLRERSEAFVLQQGDALRLHQVSDSEYRALIAQNNDGLGGARLEVLT
jgi:KipI family sensor histidine kinase inhibitor